MPPLLPAPPAPGRPPRGVASGAAFLMATSAIGPGFLTQTAVFAERQGRSGGASDWSENVSVGVGGPQEETPLDA